MKRRALVALLVALAVSACSTGREVSPADGGLCLQTTEHKVFGLTYSTDQNYLNCTGAAS